MNGWMQMDDEGMEEDVEEYSHLGFFLMSSSTEFDVTPSNSI
jgi:hypothetical protein